MALLSNTTHLYLQDFVLFKHLDLGNTVGKILKFYTQVCFTKLTHKKIIIIFYFL